MDPCMVTPTESVAAVRKHDGLLDDDDDDLSHVEELLNDRMLGIADELEMIKEEKKDKKPSLDDLSHVEELLNDRMLGIADELEMIKEEKKDKKKAKVGHTISDREPTKEHLLLREALEATVKWDKSMRDKYMNGVVSEVTGKIMGFINTKTEFPPPGSEVYPKWTNELMDEARIGWEKNKTFFETLKKYPLQNCEQRYLPETGEWIMVDCSHFMPNKKDG